MVSCDICKNPIKKFKGKRGLSIHKGKMHNNQENENLTAKKEILFGYKSIYSLIMIIIIY